MQVLEKARVCSSTQPIQALCLVEGELWSAAGDALSVWDVKVRAILL